jgi:hypothetical protein
VPAITLPPINPIPVAPTLPVIRPVDASACAAFRLTSPLDGLPNGVATFYWDPVPLPGFTYQITVMDEAYSVLAVFQAGESTSISGDVSQAAIGGSFQVIVRATAFYNGQALCSDERLILRAAPDPGIVVPPRVVIPLPTATRPRVRGS